MKKRVSTCVIVLTILLTMIFSTTVSFGAEKNPNITVVNPASNSSVYSSSLLISVKITAPTTIKVAVYQKQKSVSSNGTTVSVAVTPDEYDKYRKDKAAGKDVPTYTRKEYFTDSSFSTSNNLTFYTKKLDKIPPGVYDVKVSTLGDGGKVVFEDAATAIVREKPEENSGQDNSNGASQFLQNLLKNVFGN